MMHVVRTFAADRVYKLVTTPEIWDTVAEDGRDPIAYAPDFDSTCYLAVTVDGETVALYSLSRLNRVMMDIHPHVLPEHRKEYSMESCRKVVEWVWGNAPWCQKIIGWVPTIYPNVRNFAIANGFVREGLVTDSYLKNGKIHDQWIFGLKRGKGDGRDS